jgi:hypothetical protein
MTMIEKAALALQRAWDKHDAPAMLPPLTFTDDEGRYLVRAVLQAIREPNAGMVEAAMAVVDDPNDGGFHGLVFEEQFTAAIDAALSE